MNPPPCHVKGQPVNPCAKALYAQQVEGRVDLPSEHWSGWKIRGRYLLGPGGIRVSPRTLGYVWAHLRGIAKEPEGEPDGNR